jgi:uncharacterized protein
LNGFSMIWIESLHTYPVKSLRGCDMQFAGVCGEGLSGDRRWLIVDNAGRFQTQRELRTMAQVLARDVPGGLELSHADAGAIRIEYPPAAPEVCEVVVWRDTVQARRADIAAGLWLSTLLGREVQLVHMHDVRARPSSSVIAVPGDYVSFADGWPILIANKASLGDLNGRGAGGHSMRQFRPNIVVSGADAWAEDTWRIIRCGEVTLRIVKPCERCVVTTLDPDSGTQRSTEEPLRTLGSFHRDETGGICFGQNAAASTLGRIKVGDFVEILESGPSNVVPPARRERGPFTR